MTAGAAFAAVRALHEFAALVALGELIYAWAIVRSFDRRARRAVLALLVISLFGALGWLMCETSSMSGLPLGEALTRSVVSTVLEETLFGRLWIARLTLAAALCAWLAFTLRRRRDSNGWAGREASALLVLVALYVVSLSLTGHAIASPGAAAVPHVAADAIHLLAAGAWLGALPGLAATAAAAKRSATAASVAAALRATRRFSALGIVCVGALVVSGVVNAWFLVGTPAALIGTSYGHWLIAKLAAVATMIALAAYNRQRLVPRIRAGDATALGRLSRDAWIELGLGVVVVAIVGHLGISMPAIDERPVLPSFLAPLLAAASVPGTRPAAHGIDPRAHDRAAAGSHARP